jgi:hypothetical protein
MLQTVVRVIGDEWDERTKPHRRKPIGTAFNIQVPGISKEDVWHSYLVTAHHVVDGQPKPERVFPDLEHSGRAYPAIETAGPDSRQPIGDLDLAILPFTRPDGYWINALRLDEHLWEHLPAQGMLAMPFHYVGLLAPLDRAMARSGTLGAVYETGIDHPDGYASRHIGERAAALPTDASVSRMRAFRGQPVSISDGTCGRACVQTKAERPLAGSLGSAPRPKAGRVRPAPESPVSAHPWN